MDGRYTPQLRVFLIPGQERDVASEQEAQRLSTGSLVEQRQLLGASPTLHATAWAEIIRTRRAQDPKYDGVRSQLP